MTKDKITNRIAEDVSMLADLGYRTKHIDHSEPGDPVSILCDMLYFTNLKTKWKEDVVVAIKSICPRYFEE